MPRVKVGAEGEPVVNDFRLNKVYVHLMRLQPRIEELKFSTVIQEADGQEPALALFYVISKHPLAGTKPYPADAPLVTLSGTTLEQWRVADQEYKHFAGLADPLRPIFAGMVRQHLAKYAALEALYEHEA